MNNEYTTATTSWTPCFPDILYRFDKDDLNITVTLSEKTIEDISRALTNMIIEALIKRNDLYEKSITGKTDKMQGKNYRV